MSSEKDERLEHQLVETESHLKASIDSVCSGRTEERVDTGELIRIEESLTIAASAAKEAVSIRRKLRHDREAKKKNLRRDEGTPPS